MQNQVPDDSCNIPAQQGQLYRPSGLLDVSLGRGYTLFPLIRSSLLSSTQQNSKQPDSNGFDLREFRVKLDVSDLADAGSIPSDAKSFSVPTSGLLLPGETRASSVKIIPDTLVRAITVSNQDSPVIVATVQVRAVRLGTSSELESAEFVYAVELCNGCLVQNIDPCPLDPNVDPSSVPTFTTNSCGLPQDEPLACCGVGSASVRCLTTANL